MTLYSLPWLTKPYARVKQIAAISMYLKANMMMIKPVN